MAQRIPPGRAAPGERPDNAILLTIFMEGTANPMEQITTQIALFSRLCGGKPLDPDTAIVPEFPGHYKLSFDGCGVSHGIRGTIFATGLREQCLVVKAYVDGWVAAHKTVQINFVGLSRGGIGGLYLAQMLGDMDPNQVVVNMLLFDPVPGNLIWMARYLDIAGMMNTNQCMDVSAARNLDRVVVLYPHEPLPSIAVHAPVIAKFPATCRLKEDVILGCHQGALWLRPQADSCLSFALIRDFLLEAGSELSLNLTHARQLSLPDHELVLLLRKELNVVAPTDRSAHSESGLVSIVRHAHGCFLCRSHEAFEQRLQQEMQQQQRGGPANPVLPLASGAPGSPPYMLDFVFA